MGVEDEVDMSELGTTSEPDTAGSGNIPGPEPRDAAAGDCAGENSDADDDGSSVDMLLDVESGSSRKSTGADTSNVMTTKPSPVSSERPTLSQLMDEDTDRGEAVASTSTQVASVSGGPFSTPSWNRPRFHSSPSVNAARSASPPGAGSLWALPRRRGRPSTGGVGRKKRQINPTPKHKPQPTPVRRGRPFVDTPDDSESDDPLQEDRQLLPTPTPVFNIRGKRLKSPAHSQGQSSPLDSIPCLKRTASLDPENERDNTQATATNDDLGSQSIPTGPGELQEVNTPNPKPNEDSLVAIRNSTPTKSTRRYTLMTPDDAKLVMKLRQVEKRRWKDINNYFPRKTCLRHWSYSHWTARLRDPPRLSWPWSHDELRKLDRLKNLDGLTWADIRSEFPGRQQAEVEFELLRLWARDHGWDGGRLFHRAVPPGESKSTNGQPVAG
jgi:hypothetical protein